MCMASSTPGSVPAMPGLSHDPPEPDPRSPDAPRDVEEALEDDPAEGQADARRPPVPDDPQPEPRDSGPPRGDDLVVGEGVNEGAAEMLEESPEG